MSAFTLKQYQQDALTALEAFLHDSRKMMLADAFASDDMACTLSRILRRSRSTRERLARVSARLPPVFCWMAMTMVKKRSSLVGIRSYILSNA